MLLNTSYGIKTFARLCVSEDQIKTNACSWLNILSKGNIADVLTHGTPPSMLGPDSIWQNGPKWLVAYCSKWPVTPSVSKGKYFSIEEINESFKKKLNVSAPKQSSCLSVNKSDYCDVESAINHCNTLKKVVRSLVCVMRWRLRKLRKEPD